MSPSIKSAFIYSISIFTALTCSAAEKEIQWSDSIITLNDVTVKAIKNVNIRNENPVSVTILGSNDVKKYDIANSKQATVFSPNFYIPDYGSRMTSSVYVRGMGARIDQPIVGLNIDNVPILNKDCYDFDIFDIQRIDLYRGPQSTMYGRNTMGGLISIYTPSSIGTNRTKFMLKYGSENTLTAAAAIYRSLGEYAGTSINFSYNHTDGFFTNNYNGKKADKENSINGRWKVQYEKGDVKLMNVAAFGKTLQGGYPYKYLETDEISYNDTCYYNRLTFSDGFTFRTEINKVKLSSITSFQYINDDMTLDQDFLPLDYFTLSQKRHEWTLTQDVIASGKVKANYSWLGGIYGFYKRTNMSAPVTFKDTGIRNLIENNYNRPDIKYQVKWDERTLLLNSDFMLPDYGFAVYHSSAYDLKIDHSHKLTFTADLRLDYENVGIDYHNFTNTAYTIWNTTVTPATVHAHVPVVIDESKKLSQNFVELLPKFTVSYEFGIHRHVAYATVSKGYKAGGYNTQMFSDVLQQKLMSFMGLSDRYNVEKIIKYAPEYSWNYEAGIKHFGSYINATFALFYINCRDQQLTMFPDGVTTGRIMTNAGKTRSYGAEISLKWSPSANLNFNLNYGYTNAKFKEFNNGKADYKGKYVPYAPQNTIYTDANYSFRFKDSAIKSLTLHAGARGIGKIYWNEDNTVTQPLYFLGDASAEINIKNCYVKLWTENFTSTKYNVFYFRSIGNDFVQQGRPASFGATIRFEI